MASLCLPFAIEGFAMDIERSCRTPAHLWIGTCFSQSASVNKEACVSLFLKLFSITWRYIGILEATMTGFLSVCLWIKLNGNEKRIGNLLEKFFLKFFFDMNVYGFLRVAYGGGLTSIGRMFGLWVVRPVSREFGTYFMGQLSMWVDGKDAFLLVKPSTSHPLIIFFSS